MERQRAGRVRQRQYFPLPTRVGLAVVGAALIVGGVLLVTTGSSTNAARLSRIAGIVIILGLVAIGAAVIGHL